LAGYAEHRDSPSVKLFLFHEFLRFNDNLKRSFFLDTADLENERNQLLKPKNHKSYKQLKINR